jgi:hypothetical protein
VATTNVKLTADTSQAQQAMSALKAGWINAAAGLTVIEKAFNFVAGAAEKVNQALKDQGQFYSAVKSDAELAALQISMAATDGMIKPMALAKGANVLMRGDMKLTQEQFNAVAKAAVELGRATGEDVNSVFDRLSKGVLKGSTEAFSEYGITIRATGTIHERQATILKEITSRYQGVEVAAKDAGEMMEKTANETELAMLQNAQKVDGLSQKWSQFKSFLATEWVPGGLDAVLGTSLSKTNQLKDLLWRLRKDSVDSSKAVVDEQIRGMDLLYQARKEERADEYRAFQQNIVEIDEEIKRKTRLLELAQQLAKGGAPGSQDNVKRVEKEIVELGNARVANLAMMEQYETRHAQQTSKVGALVAEEMHARKNALDKARQTERTLLAIDALQNSGKVSVMSQFEINEQLYDVRKEISDLEPQVTREMQQQATLLEVGRKAAVGMLSLIQSVQPGRILSVLGETEEQRKARLKREADEAKRKREAGKAAYTKSMEETENYLKQQDEAAAKSLDDQLAKFGQHQDAMIALKKQKADEELAREQLGYAEEINRKVEQQRRIDEARAEIITRNAEKENEIKKKAEAEDLARRKEYINKTKELVEGLSQVTLNAIFAEKKARDGMSRMDYVLKQLQAYMKAEAMKYAAKSLGYLAEGIAATFWNPPAAAAAFKASAVSAAAAAAFGGGAAAAGALGGNNKASSSGASSASKSGADAQRAEVGATEARGSVNIIIGGSGVLWGGTVDDLMRKIQDGLNSANRRGVIRG